LKNCSVLDWEVIKEFGELGFSIIFIWFGMKDAIKYARSPAINDIK